MSATHLSLETDRPVLVFGGPYGNLQSSRALLAESRRLGLSGRHLICTGDLAAYCADPGPVIDLVRESGCLVIAGNCDENLGSAAADCGCGFAPGSACDKLAAAWFTHASAAITADQKAWLASLPRRIDVCIGGRRLAVMHGAPSRINRFVFASGSAALKRRELDLIDAEGLITGHCGLPFTQVVDGRLWHDAGAIGMPANDGTADVWYAILTPRGDGGIEIGHHRLTYPWQLAADAMRDAGLPPDYRQALGRGLWPTCDVLPARELAMTGRSLQAGSGIWPAGSVRRKGRRGEAEALQLWPRLQPVRPLLDPAKFQDPERTAKGEPRAAVSLERLDTLWFNTGTLCNIACRSCYIESSPRNDRLVYLTVGDILPFLDEIRDGAFGTREIGFTGGEPFLNPHMMVMAEACLERGYEVLILTNAMKPMMRVRGGLATLRQRFGDRLRIRVSLDHYAADRHEEERGPDTFAPTVAGMVWLAAQGFDVSVAGRTLWKEHDAVERAGYQRLFDELGLGIDARDPSRLILFPEMDAEADVPEITTACWGLLGKTPSDLMCASSRMVVKRRGAECASVVACTLLPYEPEFDLGATLTAAPRRVALNHPHCAKFCVLGGASCSVKGPASGVSIAERPDAELQDHCPAS